MERSTRCPGPGSRPELAGDGLAALCEELAHALGEPYGAGELRRDLAALDVQVAQRSITEALGRGTQVVAHRIARGALRVRAQVRATGARPSSSVRKPLPDLEPFRN